MKYIWKLIVLNIALIFLIDNSLAQVTVGFQAGANLASLNGHKNYNENSPRLGGAAFMLIDIPVMRSGFISIETGIGVSQMGMRHKTFREDLALARTVKIKNILDYAVMPLYVKENFSSIYTKFGIYGAYLLNAQSKLKIQETKLGVVQDPYEDIDNDFEKNANPYDYGVSFGIGFIKNLKSKSFKRRGGRRVLPTMKVDIKYDVGIAQISTEKKPEMRLTNRVFMIGITFSTVPNR